MVLNTDAALGVSVSKFARTGEIVTSLSLRLDGQIATCWSSFSSFTGSFYVTDVCNARVTEIDVDEEKTSARVVAMHVLEGGGGRIDQVVAKTPNGEFLYVLALTGELNVLRLVGKGGCCGGAGV
jgi:hypothetical protein